MDKRIGVLMYQTSTSKGQELVAQRMVRDLIRAGNQAYLITGAYHDGNEVVSPQSLTAGKGHISVEDGALGIPVIRVESYLARWPPRRVVFRDFMRTLESIVDELKLNVLITHSTLWNGPEEAAKFVTWRRTMRAHGGYLDPIVYCHMSHFQEPVPTLYSLQEMSFRMAWNKISLTKVLDAADLVLCVTPYEKQAKIAMGAKPDKCFLFPGGVDDVLLARYAATESGEFLNKNNIPYGKYLISYLGTIEERKNPLTVLKVAEKMKDIAPEVHFVLAGRGGTPYATKVKEMAARLPNVSLVGEVTEKEKVQLMKASYANILLSRLEALGLAQLEFMYHGVPVVTSAVGGQSWVVENGEEGIHVAGPEDVDGSVKAIQRLTTQPEVWKRMSANARKKAQSTASSKIIAELDAAIDEELMKESGLMPVPFEVRATLGEPEQVLRSWRVGGTGVIATNHRLFIRTGTISRRVIETRYASVKSIEHTREIPWRIALDGLLLTALLFALPAMRPLFAVSTLNWLDALLANLSAVPAPEWLKNIVGEYYATIPLIVSNIVLIARSQSGFYLNEIGRKPVYLSGRFKEAITLIRDMQDTAPEDLPEMLKDRV